MQLLQAAAAVGPILQAHVRTGTQSSNTGFFRSSRYFLKNSSAPAETGQVDLVTSARVEAQRILARSEDEARAKAETVEVEVSDTGTGITPEQLDQVFDKFAHFSRTGSGLGLYIVKLIIEGHGQTVRVETSKGEGTSFFFTLARAMKREEASPLMGN